MSEISGIVSSVVAVSLSLSLCLVVVLLFPVHNAGTEISFKFERGGQRLRQTETKGWGIQ